MKWHEEWRKMKIKAKIKDQMQKKNKVTNGKGIKKKKSSEM